MSNCFFNGHHDAPDTLAEHSYYLIAYVWHSGNARDLVVHAQRHEELGHIKIALLPPI